MKALRYLSVVCAMSVLTAVFSYADDEMPEFMLKAQTLIAKANAKAAGLNEFSDAVLIGQNYLRRAESEYKSHQSWGKLEQKAEVTVRYYADMARLQASIVLSQIGKIEQEKERLRLEGVSKEVGVKIRIFDDKAVAVVALKDDLVKREALIADLRTMSVEQKKQLESRQAEIEQLSVKISSLTASLTAAEAKVADGSQELKNKQQALDAVQQKVVEVTKNLDAAKMETVKLRVELAALAAQKGAAESQSKEQIQALRRDHDFVAEVGKLGGTIKTGSDNMTVIFTRSVIIKAPKNSTLTVEGDKTILRIADLLKAYPEYQVNLKVHGFGQPPKNEDVAATDKMAKLIRQVLVEKGKIDPAVVEASGVGALEPIYPKGNVEGNKRVEFTFAKK